MDVRLSLRLSLLICLLGVIGSAPLRGMERVNLRNGFSYDCARREPLPDGRVRLYLMTDPNAGLGSREPNYLDLAADRIASVETLPDPVPPSPTGAATAPHPAQVDVPSLLAHAGGVHNIDAELLASIVHAESNGRATAVSRTGARGLMQLMPGTAQDLRVRDAFDPADNIDGGSTYFDRLLARYHDNLALALAAYNAGPAAVDRFHGVPPFRETRVYVARVMSEFKRRKAALASAPLESAALAKFK